jgi:DNA-binding ferritin-like protein
MKDYDSIRDLVNLLEDVQQQFRIWHWNTKDWTHLATEEVYKGLTNPMDGLAESYRVLSGEEYSRSDSKSTFESTFDASKAKKVIDSTIDELNKVAGEFKDEGINGYVGDIVQTLRTCAYKLM